MLTSGNPMWNKNPGGRVKLQIVCAAEKNKSVNKRLKCGKKLLQSLCALTNRLATGFKMLKMFKNPFAVILRTALFYAVRNVSKPFYLIILVIYPLMIL